MYFLDEREEDWMKVMKLGKTTNVHRTEVIRNMGGEKEGLHII